MGIEKVIMKKDVDNIQLHKDILCLLKKDKWKKLPMREHSNFQAYEAPEKLGAPYRVLLPKDIPENIPKTLGYTDLLTDAVYNLATAYNIAPTDMRETIRTIQEYKKTLEDLEKADNKIDYERR